MLQSAQQSHMAHAAAARAQGQHAQSPHVPPHSSPRDQNNIDPAISGTAMLGGAPNTPPQPNVGDVPEDESPKSLNKRPLSSSKRAAQNRAAQVCSVSDGRR